VLAERAADGPAVRPYQLSRHQKRQSRFLRSVGICSTVEGPRLAETAQRGYPN